MKKITIYQRGVPNVDIFDDDNEDLDKYCQELSKIFNMSNVVILKTSTSTFIGRPSQITGLNVEDIESNNQQTIETEIKEESPPEEEPPVEDIIMDID
jgi:hypothetical protein